MDYQEILVKAQEFVATVDQRLLAAAAVLLLLLLLFWRVLRRTSRIEREVARLNERLERIREEVRTISRPSLSVAPANQALVEDVVEPAETTDQLAENEEDLVAARPEEDDLLSRAAASLAAPNLGEEPIAADDAPFAEETGDSDDSFSFDESPAEFNQLDASDSDDSFSFGGPHPAEPDDSGAADDSFSAGARDESATVEQESTYAETETGPPAAAAAEEPAPSGVVRLESDPSRPGVSMVRCLSCNYKLAYPEKLAGKRVRCPSCRTGLDLP